MNLMTLVEFFESGYFLFFYTIFGFLLVLGTFMISILRTQKLPIAQLCLTALFVLLIFFKPMWDAFFKVKPESKSGDMTYDLFILIIATIVVVADHLVYLLATSGNLSKKSLFVLAPDKTGKPIFIYQDHKGRIAMYRPAFYEKLELGDDGKKFKNLAENFVIDGGNYLYKDFIKKLAEAEDGVVEFTIQFADHDAKFALEKITVEDDGSKVGAIYVEAGEQQPKEEPIVEEQEETLVPPVEEQPQEEQPEEEPQEEQPEEEPQEEQPEEEPQEEQPEEEPQEEQPEEQPQEEQPEEEPQEEQPEEEPQEEQPEEQPQEEQPEEQPQEEQPEEEPEGEKQEPLSMDDLNKVDLDNSFLDDEDKK